MLPHKFPPWQSVCGYFRRWCQTGVWQQVHQHLRERWRMETGRDPQCECQRTGQSVGQNDGKRGRRGFDKYKKVKGRKRHLLVDMQGMVLGVHITSADVLDEYGGMYLLRKVAPQFPRLAQVWVEGAYRPLFIVYAWHIRGIQTQMTKLRASAASHKRWVVERTFAWLGRYRRLSKDYEYWTATSETWIYIAMTHLLVKRLGRS
jgi:putative transposase